MKTIQQEADELLPRPHLSDDEMLDFILDNSLADWQGELDINEAKQIAGASVSGWTLTSINPRLLMDTVVEPRKQSSKLPPIVLQVGEQEYEVLDGRHRISEANYAGLASIQVYLGTI